MEAFLSILVNELGQTDDEYTRAQAQLLADIARSPNATPQEKALAAGFVAVLNRVRMWSPSPNNCNR